MIIPKCNMVELPLSVQPWNQKALFYLGEVSVYGKFKINCWQVCCWKHEQRLFTRDVCLQMCPLPEVQLFKNLFLCDLKVELRTGSVYSRCLSSYGCMQKFGEHDRRQCIAESNSNFLGFICISRVFSGQIFVINFLV